MKRRTAILLAAVFLLLAAGLAAGLALRAGLGGSGSQGEFPDFVYHSPETERGYRLAIAHPGLFGQVACYCGCVNLPRDPHRNLLDCFMNDDGTFDAHAVGCSVCLDIAGDAVAWQGEGKSPGEVAALVDAKYRDVGPPTVR